MTGAELTPNSPREPSFAQVDLERLYYSEGVQFGSEEELRQWLSDNQVDLALADSKKGLEKLFGKIEKGEARLVLDEGTGTVLRVARVAKIGVNATIHGEQYPLVELCQIFLNSPVDEAALLTRDPDQVVALIDQLDIRSAQVRNG